MNVDRHVNVTMKFTGILPACYSQKCRTHAVQHLTPETSNRLENQWRYETFTPDNEAR